MNIWESIFLIFAFISFVLSVYFFSIKKGDKISNIILGIYLLLFSCNLVYNVLYWTKALFKIEFVNLFGILAIIWVLYPILIYLYLRRIILQQKFDVKDLIHSIPLFIVIFMFHRIFLLESAFKLETLMNGRIGEFIYLAKYSTLIISVIMIFYSLIIFQLIRNSNIISYSKRLWVKWVFGSFLSYVLAMFTYFILSRLQLINKEHDYFIMFFIVVFIGLVSYFGIWQPEVFNGLSINKILPIKKYRKTGLSYKLSLELKSKLIDLMEKEKPYLNSNIGLNDLSEKLNLSRHHTSQIINEHFDSSFYFFLNKYRVEEALTILNQDSSLTINEVVYASGFNNRVSFYKAFKLHTGVTPSEYKRNIPSF